MRKAFLAAAALAGACLVALSAGDAGAAGAPDRAPRANGVGAPIAWGVCDPPGPDLQCARIRVPLDWDRPNGRTISLALIRHLASKPERADRHAVHQPGRARRHRRRPGAAAIPMGSTPSAAVASTSSAGIPAAPTPAPGCKCFTQPAQRIALLGRRLDPDHQGGIGGLRAHDRRLRQALRRGQRLASAPHLDRRHRPRPRPPARPDGRGEAHLRRPLLRHLPRPDLRQHVPRPDPGDDAQRHRRSRSSTRRGRRRGLAATVSPADAVYRPVPRPLRRRRTGALRARRRPPHRGRALPAACQRG